VTTAEVSDYYVEANASSADARSGFKFRLGGTAEPALRVSSVAFRIVITP